MKSVKERSRCCNRDFDKESLFLSKNKEILILTWKWPVKFLINSSLVSRDSESVRKTLIRCVMTFLSLNLMSSQERKCNRKEYCFLQELKRHVRHCPPDSQPSLCVVFIQSHAVQSGKNNIVSQSGMGSLGIMYSLCTKSSFLTF